MVKSLPIFVNRNQCMVKYVLMSVVQATLALDQALTSVTTATGHKVDFTAKVKLNCTALVKVTNFIHDIFMFHIIT